MPTRPSGKRRNGQRKSSECTSGWGRSLRGSDNALRSSWPEKPAENSLVRRSTNSATGSMRWGRGPWRPLPMSSKKRAGYEGASCVCPLCQADARFVERRAKQVTSLRGDLTIRRPYYHCRACHQGHVPWDAHVGLGARRTTPAAAEVICIAGVRTSFAQVSEGTVRKMCGLRLSESTVERGTEEAGRGGGE